MQFKFLVIFPCGKYVAYITLKMLQIISLTLEKFTIERINFSIYNGLIYFGERRRHASESEVAC